MSFSDHIRRLLGRTQQSPVPGDVVQAPSLRSAETVYFDFLINSFEYLSLKGLLHGHIPQIRLKDIYISLKAIPGVGTEGVSLGRLETARTEQTRTAVVSSVLVDESFYDKRDRVLIKTATDDLLAAHRMTTILGEPGSGKTTLIRHVVARVLADPRLYREKLNFRDNPVPIPIVLRSVDPDHLPDISHLRDICVPEMLWSEIPRDYIADVVRRGSCLLVFDGLDEITVPEQRRRVGRWIEQLAAAGGRHNRYVVTSRIVGYREAPLAELFATYTLCDFDLDDIRSFVLRWYESVGSVVTPDDQLRRRQVAHRSERLLEIMKDKPGIAQLARNPLLLTIVLLVYTNRGRLPEERAELYRQCIDVLLEHLQQARLEEAYQGAFRPTQTLRLDQRRDLLKAIAQWLHEKERTAATEEEISDRVLADLLPQMGSDRSIAGPFLHDVAGRSGLLVERSRGIGFSHLAFQEFLTALALADTEERAAVDALIQVRFLPWWREVLQLYAGIVRDATMLLSRLLTESDSEYAHSLLLAGECLCDARKVRDLELRQTIIERLTQLYLTSPFSFHRHQARDVLVRIGGIEIVKVFLPILETAGTDVVQMLAVVQVLSRLSNTFHVRSELIGVARRADIADEVRMAAVRGLALSAYFDEEIEQTLFELMTPAHSMTLRSEASATLGKLTAEPRVVDRIHAGILSAPQYDQCLDQFYVSVAEAFLRHLEPEDAISLLNKHLQIRRAEEYKCELCRVFLTLRIEETRRVDELLRLMASGIDWGVRGGAALVLGLAPIRRQEIGRALASALRHEPEIGARFRIADALGHLGYRDDGILGALREAAATEAHLPTKRKIKEALAALTMDERFIHQEFVDPILRKRTDDNTRAEHITVLQRIRFFSDEVIGSLVEQLPGAGADLAKTALSYLAETPVLPRDVVEPLQTFLRRVLSDEDADRVLRDRAFEAMFQLYGFAEAEKRS